MPQFRYTFFATDDHVPGPRHIECLIRCAESLQGRFATIGQDGRVIRDGRIVKRRTSLDPAGPTPVDFVTSSELMETRHISAAAAFRQRLADYDTSGAGEFLTEDDLILCCALQTLRAAPCYVTPACEPDEWWAAQRLPAPHALSARPDHAERRNRFIETVTRLGWRSFVPHSAG